VSATAAEIKGQHNDVRQCAECKQPIPLERLAVVPTATLCTTAKPVESTRGGGISRCIRG